MTVVIGVDRSAESKRVLEAGKRLAERAGTDLDVVHVLSRSDFMDLQRTSVSETSEPVDMDEIRAIAAEIAEEATEGILDDFEAVGLVGDAADELVRWADKRDAEYIVVGVRKRSPVGKAVFGSVSQQVLLSSDRPVLAVPRTENDS